MEPKNSLQLAVSDKIDDVEISPSRVPLALLGEFQRDVTELLRGSSKEVDTNKILISIDNGSLALTATGLVAAVGLWQDIEHIAKEHSVVRVDSRRAEIIMKWQKAAHANPDRRYVLYDANGSTLFKVTSDSVFQTSERVWLGVEKYVLGVVMEMGGSKKPNIHVRIPDGQVLVIWTSQDQLAESETNRMYREQLLHISAEENLLTGELRNMRLIAFQPYKPRFDKRAFDEMVEHGTRVWSTVEDNWLESYRNGEA